ncbi:MAG: hypothetical protein H7099_11440 [Gemmatimonadaceae bacterium]|nr:hypothetical protein [Gemmatimonadaceae bacterium]
MEVGFDVPLIVLVRSGDATAGGGDLNLTAKWVVREPTDSTATRLAVSGAIELPTGNAARGFGSGVADYDVNFVAEWPHSVGGTLRANAGIQFAGNTLTGLVGIPDRGVVVSAGGSGTWSIDSRASIGLEVTGYQGRSRIAADRELRAQGALVLLVTDDAAVAVSLQRGWFASPLLLAQLGCVLDF